MILEAPKIDISINKIKHNTFVYVETEATDFNDCCMTSLENNWLIFVFVVFVVSVVFIVFILFFKFL